MISCPLNPTFETEKLAMLNESRRRNRGYGKATLALAEVPFIPHT